MPQPSGKLIMKGIHEVQTAPARALRKQKGAEIEKQQPLLTQPLLRRENFSHQACQLWSVNNRWEVSVVLTQDTNLLLRAAQMRRADSTDAAMASGEHLFLLHAQTVLCFCFVVCCAWVMGGLAQHIRFSFTKLFTITFCLPIFCSSIFHFKFQVLNSYGSFNLSTHISTSCK